MALRNGNRFSFSTKHLIAVFVLISVAGLLYAFASAVPWWSSDDVVVHIRNAGQWGPAALVVIMAAAIVLSPIPSAPITLAAGAVYGHFWGTVYALAGAEIGALIAFELARCFGRDRISRWFGKGALPSMVDSQIGLAAAVFVARLLPAVSFDVISYAAGLTRLRRLWFAIATAAGMIPATFLLSHAGAGLIAIDGEGKEILFSLAGLALLSIIGLVVGVSRSKAGDPKTHSYALRETPIE
jgi:uncharacterized membrane protein YdjX (TVP38/TMEM64 family)